MFEYIFGVTWKYYSKTMFDKNNFLATFITLGIAILIGYIKGGIIGAFIAFIIWAILFRLFGIGGSIIF